LERFTNIIIIYSAIAIFLVPICQDICQSEIIHWFPTTCFIVFVSLFLISLFFTISLIIPVDVSSLKSPKNYYETLRLEYEQQIDPQIANRQAEITKLLQASYIDELEQALEMNIKLFTRKSSFYYNALMFGLLSALPFLICLGFHIAKKEDKTQKIEVVNSEKCLNLEYHKLDSLMSKNNVNTAVTTSSTTTATATKLPGVDNTQVIRSSPNVVKENSSKIRKR
jgi:hypothetical protein